MSIVIAYASKSGTTEKAAKLLQEKIPSAVLVDLRKEKPSPKDYDTIILGGSIRINHIHKALKKYIEENKDALLLKKLGLFICCGVPEKAQEQLETNFPEELRNHALAVESFGGEMDPKKLKGIEKAIAKSIAREENHTELELFPDVINAFAEKFGND